jgi:hypothetical protein
MKIVTLLLSLTVLLVPASQAKDDVRVTNAEYGFSVKLPEGVSLVRHKQDDGVDSLGNATKCDTFESSDSNFSATVYVTTYAESIPMTADNLETFIQRFSDKYSISKVDHDTIDGQPSASALLESKADDGTYMLMDVLATAKGNRLYMVYYIRNPESKLDLNGSLFIQSFRMQ